MGIGEGRRWQMLRERHVQKCQLVVEEPSQLGKSKSKDFVGRLLTCDGHLLVAGCSERFAVVEAEGGS